MGWVVKPLVDLKNGKNLHSCDKKMFYFSSLYSCRAL